MTGRGARRFTRRAPSAHDWRGSIAFVAKAVGFGLGLLAGLALLGLANQ